MTCKRKRRKLVKCSWCDKTYLRKSNAQKYCSPKCKHNARLETQRKATAKYRKLYGRPEEIGGTFIKKGNKLVNVSLGGTRHEDPLKELDTVHKMILELGLNNNRGIQCKKTEYLNKFRNPNFSKLVTE